MAALALSCRLLTALDLTCCHDVSDAALLSLADFCSHLQLLRLEGCPGVTPAALLALAHRCPALRHLDLTDTALDDTAAPALAAATNLQVRHRFGLPSLRQQATPPQGSVGACPERHLFYWLARVDKVAARIGFTDSARLCCYKRSLLCIAPLEGPPFR